MSNVLEGKEEKLTLIWQ